MNLSVLASTSNRTVDPKVSFTRIKIDQKLTHTFRCMRCEVQHAPLRETLSLKGVIGQMFQTLLFLGVVIFNEVFL